VTARRDVAYGGQYGSEVSTELTALPVRVPPGSSLPPPTGLAGWFVLGGGDGQPLTVAAVENGPAKVILVRAPSGKEVLDKLVPSARRSTVASLQTKMELAAEDRVRFLSLGTSPYHSSKVPAELFDMSRELTAKDGGLFWYLTNSRLLKEPKKRGRRIADAVAVAGLQASAENDRRAVVLVLGGESEDASRYDVATVRHYLESIRVPLFVWALYGPETPGAKAWTGGGAADDISTLAKLGAAVDRLKADLAEQRIVWLDGRHLPQAVALGAEAKGVELVTAAPLP
jgi:hypothetical protein